MEILINRKDQTSCQITERYLRDALWIPRSRNVYAVAIGNNGRRRILALHNNKDGNVIGPTTQIKGEAYDVRFECGCTLPAARNELIGRNDREIFGILPVREYVGR